MNKLVALSIFLTSFLGSIKSGLEISHTSDAFSLISQAANNFYAKIMVPVYTHIFVSVAKASKNIATEVVSAGTDIGKGGALCAQVSGKFAYDHPEFTAALVVLASARAAYVMYLLPAYIIKKCRHVNQCILDPVIFLKSSNSRLNINALENNLLWHSGIYYRIKLGSFITRSYYREELDIIQGFTQELRKFESSKVTDKEKDINLIRHKALQVKLLLTKRLSVENTMLV